MRRAAFACLFLLLIPAALAAAGLPKPTGEDIVPADAKLELLYTRSAPIEGGLTEGPAVAPDGSIYFSDIPVGEDKGLIVRFDPKTKKTSVFAENSHKSNGLIFDAEGYLLACEGSDHGGRSVSRWNVKTGERKIVADKYQGKKFNACNDICLDAKGRIYFTDPRYLGDEPRELEHRAVYRIDSDGKVSEATHDVVKPNGIALSPDGKTLYVANHDNGTDKIDPTKPAPKEGVMNIVAFEVDPKSGDLVAGPKVLIDFKDKKGCDGMCVDTNGNLYLTVRDSSRPGVLVANPQGEEIAFIPTGPADQGETKEPIGLPSNVEFGIGEEQSTLYVTVDKSLYRIGLKSTGYHAQYVR